MADPETFPPGGGQDLFGAVQAMSAGITELNKTVATLNTTVDTQTKQLKALQTSQDGLRSFSRWLAALYALDILLIIASVATFAVIISNAAEDRRQLRAIITEQTQTRDVALCPLFRILSSLASPAARDRYPFGPEAYDKDTAELRLGYLTLNCTN